MAMLVSLDWRPGLATVQLAPDPCGGLRLVLQPGLDELVVHVSESDRAAPLWESRRFRRPTTTPPPGAPALGWGAGAGGPTGPSREGPHRRPAGNPPSTRAAV